MRIHQQIPDLGLWALSALLMTGSLAGISFGTELLPSGPPSLLAEATWQIPLSMIPGIHGLLEWEALWFVVGGSLIIASVSQRFTKGDRWEQLVLLVGLSLLIRPADLFCAAVLVYWGGSLREPSPAAQDQRRLSAALASVLVTLDFGIVLGLVLVESVGALTQSANRRQGRWWALAILLGALALAVWYAPGLGSAALRPIGRFWLRPSLHLLPSLSSVWNAPELLLPVGLICLTLVSQALSDRTQFRPCWFAALMWIAVSSQRGTFLWLLCLVIKHIHPEFSGHLLPQPRRVKIVVGGIMALWAAWTTGALTLMTGSPMVATRVDPTLWESQGVVILTNLDRSAMWKRPEARRQFRLLADDRWDTFPDQLDQYAALCRDLEQVRDHRYWRTDGQWGGYKLALEQWSPALLVVETTDVDSIRGLSLSPDWRVMGLDGKQVIFGRVGDKHNARQMQHAIATLMTLEWPARLEQLSLENTIVTANADDDRAVAAALCALRFPYAALRFTRHEASPSPVRAQCVLQLAHRVARHSATGSLFDQYCAVVFVRDVLNRLPSDSAESIRLNRGLQALLNQPLMMPEWITEDIEQRLRRALLSGDTTEAETDLQQLPVPRQAYYRCLCEAPRHTPEQTVQALNTVIGTYGSQLPVETLAEAHFYAGCAALEAGQMDYAIPAFAESIRLDADSPYREIRKLYVQQLSH